MRTLSLAPVFIGDLYQCKVDAMKEDIEMVEGNFKDLGIFFFFSERCTREPYVWCCVSQMALSRSLALISLDCGWALLGNRAAKSEGAGGVL